MAENDRCGGDTDQSPDQIDREQVEVALRALEWSHGDALRRPWSDEAHAYYHAIDLLEGALGEEFRPLDEIHQSERDKEAVQRSRDAREEGYRAATLLDERFSKNEVTEKEPTGIIGRIMEIFV